MDNEHETITYNAIAAALKKVDPKWHEQLWRYVEGVEDFDETDNDFLSAYYEDENMRTATDLLGKLGAEASSFAIRRAKLVLTT